MYYVIFGLLGAALLGADQWVKAWVVGHLQMGETTSLFPGFLELMRVHNYGAAWSSFSGARWLLIALTAAGMCAIAWLLVKIVRHPLGQWSLAIILGGGIGNLIDRVLNGEVVDYINPLFIDFAVFNFADILVCVGVALWVLVILLEEVEDKPSKEQ